MKIIDIEKTDDFVTFIFDDQSKATFPNASIIYVDDESGATTVKLKSSRATVGYFLNE